MVGIKFFIVGMRDDNKWKKVKVIYNVLFGEMVVSCKELDLYGGL